MNCDKARHQLQDLLDGGLSARAEAGLRMHLTACRACRRERALLEEAAVALRALPLRHPTPGFDGRVLAAAAAARRASVASRVTSLLLNVAASAVTLWAAGLAAFARPRLNASTLVAGLHALRHPVELYIAAQVRLAEAGLALPEALRAFRHAFSVFARSPIHVEALAGTLALQSITAALIAAMIVAATVRAPMNLAVSRRKP